MQAGRPCDLVDVPDSSKHGRPDHVDTGAGDEDELTLMLREFAATSNNGVFPLKPRRPVCRFRCVSTSWSSLLRHPGFVTAHRARHYRPLIAATVRLDCSGSITMGFNLLDMSGNVVKMIRTSAAVTECSLYGMCARGELGCLVGRTDRRIRVLDKCAQKPPSRRGHAGPWRARSGGCPPRESTRS
ncbi:hypothetical protein ZWY2020_005258 [Hordeum vulgare]|nr:hypothetical protein ZWY2020_005258 [Hordeum vulgare]